MCVKLNRRGTQIFASIAPLKKTRWHVHGFLQQKTLDDYREELAKERSETERLFILTVLARKEAEGRRRSARAWMVVKGRAENDVELRP
jgi:hypothetical protein